MPTDRRPFRYGLRVLAVIVIGFGFGAPAMAETPSGLSWLMRKLDIAPAPTRKRSRSASAKKSDVPPLPNRKPSTNAAKSTPSSERDRTAARRDDDGDASPPAPPERKPSVAENRSSQRENGAAPPPRPDRKPAAAADTEMGEPAPPPLPRRNPIAKLSPKRAEPENDNKPIKHGKGPREDLTRPREKERQMTEEPKVEGRQPASAKARAAERRKVTSEPQAGVTVLQKTPPTKAEREHLRRDRERREQEEVERAERELAERQRLEFETAERERVERAKAEQARAGLEKSGPERPGAWGWTNQDVAMAKERCALLLANMAISYKIQPPIRQGGCGAPAPILVSSIGSNPAVQISPPAVINCTLASGLDRWIKTAVQPNAATHLGSPVVKLHNAAAYDCRGRNGARSGKLSEHAFANALDIGVFETQSGRTVTVLTQWPKRWMTRAPAYGPLKRGVIAAATASELPSDGNAAFLVSTHHAACGIFGTVLGPAADAAHRSHFHLDMAKRRRSAFCE